MFSSFCFDQDIILKKNVFFCLKIFFTFTNSVDPDEMQHYAAFHLGIHCLPKYSFGGFPNTKWLRNYGPGHGILEFTVKASSKGSDEPSEPDNQAFTQEPHKEGK